MRATSFFFIGCISFFSACIIDDSTEIESKCVSDDKYYSEVEFKVYQAGWLTALESKNQHCVKFLLKDSNNMRFLPKDTFRKYRDYINNNNLGEIKGVKFHLITNDHYRPFQQSDFCGNIAPDLVMTFVDEDCKSLLYQGKALHLSASSTKWMDFIIIERLLYDIEYSIYNITPFLESIGLFPVWHYTFEYSRVLEVLYNQPEIRDTMYLHYVVRNVKKIDTDGVRAIDLMINDNKETSQGRYLDFANPCPPICEGSFFEK